LIQLKKNRFNKKYLLKSMEKHL